MQRNLNKSLKKLLLNVNKTSFKTFNKACIKLPQTLNRRNNLKILSISSKINHDSNCIEFSETQNTTEYPDINQFQQSFCKTEPSTSLTIQTPKNKNSEIIPTIRTRKIKYKLLNPKPSSYHIPSITRFICSGKSEAGNESIRIRKINQDSFFTYNKSSCFNHVIGLFDGHGTNGHLVSQYLREFFLKFFSSPECITLFRKYYDLTISRQEEFQQAIRKCYYLAEKNLKQVLFDTGDSGSTGIMVVSFEDKILCMNTGDSRAIYIDSNKEVVQISNDHKPNLPQETRRIIESGGFVKSDGEIYRIYSNDGCSPGLALSRAFADFNSESIGIICEPEIFELSVKTNKIKAIVTGSDGLWDTLSNETIRDLIMPFMETKNVIKAKNKLIEEARKSWFKEGDYCDDITVVVLFV